MNQPSLIVNNLVVKMQGNSVLDGIFFCLNKDEHLAITGESGSGKTALAKALAGQIFYKGSVIYTDAKKVLMVGKHYHFKNLSNVSDFYYQQRYNSFDSNDALTVEEELGLISTDKTKINLLLRQLQLSHGKQSPLLHLSSGEHKRFQLIKALLSEPEVLIIDSPFIGLDINSREKLCSIFNEIASNGTQIILITNEQELPGCITHIAIIESGRLKSFQGRNSNTIELTSDLQGSYFNFNNLPRDAEKENHFSLAVKMVNTSVKYESKTILNNINWEIRRGEKWLVKGHNGAGKSTLLSLITGDNPQAYANEIYLFDKRRGTGESIWDIKQKIGYISPELHWYFDTNITCYQTVGSGFFDTVGLYKKLNQQQQNIVMHWLDFLHLSHVANKPLSSVSNGHQRLILLSRALVKNPPLLVLDEPCQGLDAHQKNEFVQLVDALCQQFNKTLIYVRHYDNEMPACITKVLYLENGHHSIKSTHSETAMAV